MKKRIATLFLAVVMAVSMLIVPAEAASATFYDVSDDYMATAIETLRLMGVLDGYGDGSFRPEENLTRAQFSKMAVFAMDGSRELGQYATITIFPDVKPSHWASSYVNMAARKGIITGFSNGTFGPERTVTAAQAVAILLRMLGYKDTELGGVWPISYMKKAEEIGLTKRVNLVNPNAPLNRGQAAILFMNLLQAETAEGGTLYEMSELVRLTSVNGGRGTMTAGGEVYPMVKAVASTTLTGLNGWVITHNGKALTFLPSIDGSNGVTNAAVIIYEDGNAAGLAALAGNTNYKIYKNGILVDASDLREYDVATYYAETNSVLVCDTRVTVYYEDCSPSASAPSMVFALGKEFSVVPTGRHMLSKFKPGDIMTLLLTADGQVAGAIDDDGDAIGVVSSSGQVSLLCGDHLVELGAHAEDADAYGQVVRVASNRGGLNLDVLSGGVSGDLNVTQRMLGKRNLASYVHIYSNGKWLELNQLTDPVIDQSEIRYAHTNWRGDVDFIALDWAAQGDCGLVTSVTYVPEMTWEDDDQEVGESEHWIVTIKNGENTITGTSYHKVIEGTYVSYAIYDGVLNGVKLLNKLEDVPLSSWIGMQAVVYDGRTYTVPADISCYNANRGEWMKLSEALDYADRYNLYTQNYTVCIIEIKQS